MNNVYYSPEKFGLEIVHEEDNGGGWDFDMLVLWKDGDGRFFMAGDAGCSCPSPFEDLGLDDLTRVYTLADIRKHMQDEKGFSAFDFMKAARAAGMVGA